MRLFISINLDKKTKGKLFSVMSEMKERIPEKHSSSIKWENRNNFHLTLFFIGEADEKTTSGIISSLSQIKIPDSGKIILKGKNISAFPSFKIPRVLFVSLNDENKNIEKLYIKITGRMELLGFKPDKKFQSHITLGRVKRGAEVRYIEPQNDINCDFIYTPKSFSLMQSTLTPEGAIHKAVKEFPLVQKDIESL